MLQLPKPQLELVDFDGVPAWTDTALFDQARVRVAFTGRAGGESEGVFATFNLSDDVDDRPINVGHNRAKLAQALQMEEIGCVRLQQVHGTDILEIGSMADAMRFAAREQADAVLVTIAGLAGQVLTADCLPLALIAPSGAFAVVHAGWRGALAGIAGKAARALRAATQEDPATFNIYIGPHIHAECLELDAETAGSFRAAYGEEAVPTERHVDLARAVAYDLAREGIDAARIADCGVCTACHSDEYFSYRASGGQCGRNGAIVFTCAQDGEGDVL